MKLFLDDIRESADAALYMQIRIGILNPIYLEKWEIAKNYDQFVEWINYCFNTGKEITHISFDHDLADAHYGNDLDLIDRQENVELTGYDCAKYFKEFYDSNKIKYPVLFIHSMNPIGTENIKNLFKN